MNSYGFAWLLTAHNSCGLRGVLFFRWSLIQGRAIYLFVISFMVFLMQFTDDATKCHRSVAEIAVSGLLEICWVHQILLLWSSCQVKFLYGVSEWKTLWPLNKRMQIGGHLWETSSKDAVFQWNSSSVSYVLVKCISNRLVRGDSNGETYCNWDATRQTNQTEQ